ncbi:MAG TPA: transcriptional repressor [Syntrophaceae bacterium]|nr:transcriptional repressor [Syntrophaceae bacterium]
MVITISEKVLRRTRQRQRILEVLRATKGHPTADWIYSQVKPEFPRLSLGTIYRNLKLLKEQGEILELDFGSTFSRFDGRSENHYHFICRKCGEVFDVDMPLDNNLNKKATKTTGFDIEDHRLVFYGLCKGCLKIRERR